MSFRQIALRRLRKQALAAIEFSDIITALESMNTTAQAVLVNYVKQRAKQQVGYVVLAAVANDLSSTVSATLEDMLTDASLTTTELEDIFGPEPT